jgi:hypothetical protein
MASLIFVDGQRTAVTRLKLDYRSYGDRRSQQSALELRKANERDAGNRFRQEKLKFCPTVNAVS